MKHYKTLVMIVGAMMLPACEAMNFTSIQYKYEQQRDDCRELAEMKYELYRSGGGAALSARDVGSGLTALYNDCMSNQGWMMAGQPKEDKK